MILRLTILTACIYLVHANEPRCYVDDPNPYLYFGTSTSYEVERAPKIEMLNSEVCTPIYVWALIRTGARYWSKYDGKHLNELQRQILLNCETNERGSLCHKDLENLKSWKSQGDGKTINDFTTQGKVELLHLGKRLATTFEEFIGNTSAELSFQTTMKSTAKESAEAFIEGMFGTDEKDNVNISENENVLNFVEHSEEFRHKITENDKTFKEMQLCLASKPMQTLRKEVSDHLGFSELLPEKSIMQMYFTCAFENAWAPHSKPAFCAAFTKPQLQFLEYCYFDLLGYYEWGYGSSYNMDMYNPVLDDLLSNLIFASKTENEMKGDFHFTHAATFTNTVTKLGWYHDKKCLRHDNYKPNGRKPKWSMHTVSPFGSNLIAVLHRCKGRRSDEFRVALYHNEHLFQITPLSRFEKFVHSNNKKRNSRRFI